MKQKLFTWAVLAVCLSLFVYGTLAYFTAEETAHNVITSGDIKIDLLEWADADKSSPFPEDGVSGVMPGTEVTKIVEVKNTGTNAAWIRVKADKAIELAAGVSGDVNLGLMILNFDDTSWIFEEDGFYYYKQVLEPGEVTNPLFASVKFDTGMGNQYQNSTAFVDVTAYAVQAANNGASFSEATGWPA